MVSFNRPYAPGVDPSGGSGVGAGDFLTSTDSPLFHPVSRAGWEYYMLRWLEREGYDVTYCTDLDTHCQADLLLSHRGFLVVGHDDYWTWEMRQNVTRARDLWVNLGFFGANAAYWQIRLEPSTIDGAANRMIVAYKDSATTRDPYALDGIGTNNYLITARFRDLGYPEDALIGVMYDASPVNVNMVIYDASHWVCAGTGLRSGDVLPGLVGYEMDRLFGHAPAGTALIAHSPVMASYSDMTAYTAGSGATVFATGSMQWIWALDDFNAGSLRPTLLNTAAQQMTRNVLARFIGSPAATGRTLLRCNAGNGQVLAAWTATPGASGYNVKRAAASGGPYTTIASGTTSLSYVDTGLSNGTTYYYVVAPLNGSSEWTVSNQVAATPQALSPLRIDSGGTGYSSATAGAWITDTNYSLGSSWIYSPATLTNGPDVGLYASVRYGTRFIYDLPAGYSAYSLNLRFAELYHTAAGRRRFHVTANGVPLLQNYDIFADAGGANIAIVRAFPVTVANGTLNVSFTSAVAGASHAVVAAIELTPASPMVTFAERGERGARVRGLHGRGLPRRGHEPPPPRRHQGPARRIDVPPANLRPG